MHDQTNSKLSALRTAIQHAQETCRIPGLAVAVAYGKGPTHTIAVGTDEKGHPLVEDSLFPVASITKLSVALAILRLSDQHLLSVDDSLRRFVPDAASAQSGVTLKQLLTHTAGLPDFSEKAWKYDEALNWQIQAQACLTIIPHTLPGTRVAYSDVGYGLLAIVLERITRRSYQDVINELVIQPLGIEAYLGIEPPRIPAMITDPPDQHAGTPLERWNTPFWRSLGEPWVGMVTTPAGTLGLLRAYLGMPKDFLLPETRAAAIQDQTGGLGGGFPWQEWSHCPWGLGPMIITEHMNHWLLPTANPGTVCFGGYSGCAVFADPAADEAWSIHGTRTAADDWHSRAFP